MTTTLDLVAKKKPEPDPPPEPDRSREKPTLGLRFPAKLIQAMRRLAAANRRPITTEMEIAFENHLKTAGLWPPQGDATE